MRLNDQKIVVGNDAEQMECSKAAEYGSSTNTIYTGIQEFEFSSGTSYLILKGLAHLSLQDSGIDFHGLTPQTAWGRISELCGDAEDYVPQEWAAEVQ
jgi:hypothetical protein